MMPIDPDMNTREDGWTFIEAIVVIAIILLLSGTVAFSSLRYIDQARVAGVETDLAALGLALQGYYIDNGSYPSTAQGLQALWEKPSLHPIPNAWTGPYINRSVGDDPWANDYAYETLPGDPGRFRITCYGADHMPGGTGTDADRSVEG